MMASCSVQSPERDERGKKNEVDRDKHDDSAVCPEPALLCARVRLRGSATASPEIRFEPCM